MADRTVTIKDIWARSATTTIPGSPTPGTTYRDETLAAVNIEEGWSFLETVDSPIFNQVLFELYTLVRDIEQKGAAQYSPLTDYPIGALCTRDDGATMKAVTANGPATTVYDPNTPANIPSIWSIAIPSGAAGAIDFLSRFGASGNLISGSLTDDGDGSFNKAAGAATLYELLILGEKAVRINAANWNTELGYQAGESQDDQTAIGYRAGDGSATPSQTVVGSKAGLNNSGEVQTAVGFEAGSSNAGDNQVTLGAQTGQLNTGHNSVFVGYGAGISNALDNFFEVKHLVASNTPLLTGDFANRYLGVGLAGKPVRALQVVGQMSSTTLMTPQAEPSLPSAAVRANLSDGTLYTSVGPGPVFLAEEREPDGVDAPASAIGLNNVRGLNTEVFNNMPGNVSFDAVKGEMTIEPGTYWVSFDAPATGSSTEMRHQAYLHDKDNAAVEIVGTTERAGGVSGGNTTRSLGEGQLVVIVQTIYELKQFFSAVEANGQGEATSSSLGEVYARIKIRKDG